LTGRDAHIAGDIVAAFGRQFLIETAAREIVRCLPRGKRAQYACGDHVLARRTGAGEAVLEAADPRSTLFVRAAPHRRKLLAANATQVAVIVAGEPSASDELTCRILIAAGSQGMRGLIVLNKADLEASATRLRERLQPLIQTSHEILPLSAREDTRPLRARLRGELTILIGQSGMGKSTIVNALVPDADAATQEISRFLGSGRHTTSYTRLYRLDGESAIIDSPGLQEFGLAHLSATDIARSFGGIGPLAEGCRFRDCRHRSEPGCAIRAAVANGTLPARQLEILHRILDAEAAAQ
jgi:ribosome biogenesis GTPase / thiamine phosphate phosphatase